MSTTLTSKQSLVLNPSPSVRHRHVLYHQIVSFNWIYCNPKPTIPCPLPSNPPSGPCLGPCHEIVSLYSIHCNLKLETPCPSSSDPRSGPCAWPHAIKLCSSLGSIATLNQQRPVHRPQIQDLVPMLGRMP